MAALLVELGKRAAKETGSPSRYYTPADQSLGAVVVEGDKF
jgi:hypothetical protein